MNTVIGFEHDNTTTHLHTEWKILIFWKRIILLVMNNRVNGNIWKFDIVIFINK